MLTSIKEILAAISKLFSSSKNESHSHNSTDPPAQGISSEGEIPAVNLTTVTVTDHGSGLNDDVTRTGLSTGGNLIIATNHYVKWCSVLMT